MSICGRISLNTFADHAPKCDWLVLFFDLKDFFFTEHTLGPVMFVKFKRFLKDAGLIARNQLTDFAQLIGYHGWESDTALGLMLVNLAMDNPQIAWYIHNMDIGFLYTRKELVEKLVSVDVKPKDAKSIITAFKRIVQTPFGTVLNFGYVTADDELVRSKCSISDIRVILYGLYKYGEKRHFDEFSLLSLYDEDHRQETVSPVRLFGLEINELTSILGELTYSYPEYIRVVLTGSQPVIVLRHENTSQDVLTLF